MVTIKDIARVCGVSKSTVSRVVRGEGKVSDASRVKVQKIIKELGYRPNTNARALVEKKSDIIGVVIPDASTIFFNNMIKGISRNIRGTGYKMMVSMTPEGVDNEIEGIESLKATGCENIIVHSQKLSDEYLIDLAERTPGLVIIGRLVNQIKDRCIWLDNRDGGAIAANYIRSQGHEKIAILSSSFVKVDAQHRIDGIQQALTETQLCIPIENIQYVQGGSGQDGAWGVNELQRKGIEFTALIAFNDNIAIDAMLELQRQGINIPQDISIIGFDDLVFCKICRPTLSSILYPILEMAEYAVKLSLSFTGQPKENTLLPMCNMFSPTLIKRDSVAKSK